MPRNGVKFNEVWLGNEKSELFAIVLTTPTHLPTQSTQRDLEVENWINNGKF